MFKTVLSSLSRPHYSKLLSNGRNSIHLCSCDQKTKSTPRQQANFMLKIMSGSKNPKIKMLRNMESEVQRGMIVSATRKDFPLNSCPSGRVNQRRKAILNALFSRHIVDHMATSDVQGYDIQITYVTVSPDLGLVKAYWISRTCMTSHSISLQSELDKYSVKLRRDLTNLRIIGAVPPIKFVPDKILAQGAMVDQLMLSAEMSDKIEDVDAEEDQLPPMRQDVLGLDRDSIISKVARKNSKLGASNANMCEEFESVDLVEIQEKIKEFKLLLKVRRNQKLKENKFRRGDPEPQFYNLSAGENFYDNWPDNDYITEDDRGDKP